VFLQITKAGESQSLALLWRHVVEHPIRIGAKLSRPR
jgi:hypothetical protein